MLRGLSLMLLAALLGPAHDAHARQTPPADLESRLSALEGADTDSIGTQLERVGVLYLLAVDQEARIDEGLAALDALAAAAPNGDRERALAAQLLAYRGAFITLRAKHAFWPHQKLGHVKNGASRLDEAVALAPEHAPVRYLRLMSGFYLPGVLGRGDEVEADFAALARLLPDARAEFPGDLYRVVIDFVLEHARLDDAQRARLERAREAA